MVNVQVKLVCNYNGHNCKSNGSIDLNVKTAYEDIGKSIQMIQMLNNDIKLSVKFPDEKPFGLGVFRLQNMNIDHDGSCKIKFNSLDDFVEVNNLNRLLPNKSELFILRAQAEIEEEDNDDNEEESEE